MVNKKIKILVVEDEEAISDALEAKLELSNFEVLKAKDGEEGLKMALEKNPDLVLLDILLPKMDGITMLGKLKETKVGEKIPVIILTNLSDNERLRETVEEGKYDYLIKSNWKIDDVIEKVKEKLNIKR